jgi:mycothiol synthase
VRLRAPTNGDVPELTRFMNQVSDELFGEADESEDEVRRFLSAPDLDPRKDIRIATADGGIAGYCDITGHPPPRYWIDLRVPLSGSDSAREALLSWAERRARERGAGQPDAVARVFSWSDDQPLNALVERSGYQLIRKSYRMRIELSGELEEPRWPDGVAVRPATEADEEAAYEAQMETFEDAWEHLREPIDDWRHWMVDTDHDWSLWFVAEADGEVAGVALCRPRPADPDVGLVRVLGVRRAWRRRGVGRALLLHAFAEFRRRGARAVVLGVDAESLTGAHRLYESAGMKVYRQSNIYDKPLAAGTV